MNSTSIRLMLALFLLLTITTSCGQKQEEAPTTNTTSQETPAPGTTEAMTDAQKEEVEAVRKQQQVLQEINSKLEKQTSLLYQKDFSTARENVEQAKKMAEDLPNAPLVLDQLNALETMVDKVEDVAKSCADTDQTAMPEKGEEIAVITTSKGVIKARLFACDAPEIVKNFTTHAANEFYNNLIFHRVIPDFMIQGGDPLGTGMGGYSYKGEGTKLEDEFSPNLDHMKGALSMANSGPNTNGSQFFIVQREGGTPWLNFQHTVFGQVFEGMDVVDTIAAVETKTGDIPVVPVTMEKVEIVKY